MPMSPLKLQLENTIAAYVNPFFTQRWNFFAPTPPLDSDWVVARAMPATAAGGIATATPWQNISAPLERAVARDRLTPLFMVELGLSNALGSFMNNLATDPKASLEQDGKRVMKSDLPDDDAVDLGYIRRTAAAYLEVVYPRRTFSQIQIGILRDHYPRFTERNAARTTDSVSLSTVPWAAFPRVEPFCCQAPNSR